MESLLLYQLRDIHQITHAVIAKTRKTVLPGTYFARSLGYPHLGQAIAVVGGISSEQPLHLIWIAMSSFFMLLGESCPIL